MRPEKIEEELAKLPAEARDAFRALFEKLDENGTTEIVVKEGEVLDDGSIVEKTEEEEVKVLRSVKMSPKVLRFYKSALRRRKHANAVITLLNRLGSWYYKRAQEQKQKDIHGLYKLVASDMGLPSDKFHMRVNTKKEEIEIIGYNA